MHQYRLGPTSWKAAFQKKTGSTGRQQVECESEMYPCGKEGQKPLGCIRKSIASKSREKILPLCSALVGHTWGSVSGSGAPQSKREMYVLERVQQKATKIIK